MPELPREIDLYHHPTQTNYIAQIVRLTPEIVAQGMGDAWWQDDEIEINPDDPPVDIDWPWADVVADYHRGRFPETTFFVAVVMGEFEVQGAMCVDAALRPSASNPDESAIFIEAIATAPRNRPELRADGGQWLAGVGVRLLAWAVDLSIEAGCGGRIELFASPKGIPWYVKRGFTELNIEKKRYDGVEYVPMELKAGAAAVFKRSLSEGF